MFNALSSLGNRRQIITNEEATLLHDRHTTLRAARQYTTARCAIMSATTNMRGITQDLTDLRRLSHVINRYGINRPLIEFAGSVKKIVSCVPSNENLDVVTADGSDPRTINTIDGIDQYLDTEPTMVADWVRTSSDNIKSLLVSTTDQIHGFAEAISYYLTVLENNTVDSETLSNTTITAVAYSDAIGCIQALLDILPDLDAAVSDPTDNDAIAAHKSEPLIEPTVGETRTSVKSDSMVTVTGVDEFSVKYKFPDGRGFRRSKRGFMKNYKPITQ